MQTYRRWVLGLTAGVLVFLMLCGGLVYAADPCFYYRYPGSLPTVFFNERYQDAGLAKNASGNTVLLGTSMVTNYRVSWVKQLFGGTAVKLPMPDGYLSELDHLMQVVWRNGDPQRVIFGLDINILVRDESEKTDALPGYLYDQNSLNDVQYLLNKDTLYYSLYRGVADKLGAGTPEDDAFIWGNTVAWSKATALAGYDRPDPVAETLPSDAYVNNTQSNLNVVEGWLSDHPDTEFDIFFPPYSILYWDKERRLGETDAVFDALKQAFDQLLPYDNVRLYFFPADREIVTNLDNYGDYIHHSGEICRTVLQLLKAGDYRVTADNAEAMLADWHEFVVNYDYDAIWADNG